MARPIPLLAPVTITTLGAIFGSADRQISFCSCVSGCFEDHLESIETFFHPTWISQCGVLADCPWLATKNPAKLCGSVLTMIRDCTEYCPV